MKNSYTYIVLRYVHDIATEEFLNVGVALFAPKDNFLRIQCRTTYGRLSRAFPGVHGEHFKREMRQIQGSFEKLGLRIQEELQLAVTPNNISEFAGRILPHDDSSLQWSTIGAGVADDPQKELDRLFDRLVMKYEQQSSRARFQDEDVWRNFRTPLENRQLVKRLKPKIVTVKDDKVEFQHTWKNGILHCLEPISFDLSSPENIRNKAHQWLGAVSSVRESDEKFRVYFLVGAPQDRKLLTAYDNAISILGKSPVENEIVREEEAESLPERLMRNASISRH